MSITKNKLYKTGYFVQACFQIQLNQKDQALLEMIKAYFGGVGEISKSGKNASMYRVRSVKDLIEVVFPHFDKYPLLTQKRGDFELFKEVVYMMDHKKHLTKEGLHKILAIRASMNLGLSNALKTAFPDIIPVARPTVELPQNIEPNWLAGFTEGEGMFMISIQKDKTKTGFTVRLVFQITQHHRDAALLESFIKYYGCGWIKKERQGSVVNFIASNYSDIDQKIIPFFEKYPLKGTKSLNYADFRKVAEIMKVKGHLTTEGLEKIRKIKAGMNRGRK